MSGSDILRFSSFLDILLRIMKKTSPENFFEKFLYVAEIWPFKVSGFLAIFGSAKWKSLFEIVFSPF